MRNGAYSLSFLAAVAGLVLIAIAEPGASIHTPLGTVLLVAAVLLFGLGKGIDLLGYVRDGAADPDDSASPGGPTRT